MIGRTPEYLGKKIQAREVKLAGLAVLVMPVTVLVLTGIAVSIHAGRAGPLNAGPHGFSEILYAFTSQGNNNGSAFAGLTGNTAFYNVIGAIAMLLGRFAIMIPALALAGALAAKNVVPASARDVPHRQRACSSAWSSASSSSSAGSPSSPPSRSARSSSSSATGSSSDGPPQHPATDATTSAPSTVAHGVAASPAACSIAAILRQRADRLLQEARPAGPGQEPGDVRRARRDRRSRFIEAISHPARSSAGASRSGCFSP